MYSRLQPAVDRPPGLPAIVGAERAGGGDRDEHAIGVGGIDQDGVQAQSAGARLPVRARAVAAQARQFVPGLAAVGGAEQRRVLDTRVDRVGIGQRRLEMPDPLELPGMRRAVVPLMRAGHAVVDELVADRLPRLPAVVRALHHLPEPAARLRRVDAVRVHGRALEVVDLPAAEVRAADVPLLALAVGAENERAFPGSDQHTHAAHRCSCRGFAVRGFAGPRSRVRVDRGHRIGQSPVAHLGRCPAASRIVTSRKSTPRRRHLTFLSRTSAMSLPNREPAKPRT